MNVEKKGESGVGSRVAAFAVAVGIAVAVHVILSGLNWRVDMTEGKLYQLSSGTREILAALDEPVTMTFYFSRRADVPAPLMAVARRVEDLMEEYRQAGRGRLQIATLDPRPDSQIEETARHYGLPSHPLRDGRLYMGIVVSAGDRNEALPYVDPSNEPRLEYELTRLIDRVTRAAPPRLGVISSLPVLGGPPSPFQQEPAQAWALFNELRRDYDIEKIGVPVERIASGLDVLLVVHPKDLEEETLYAIDQFLIGGGRLLVFVDPFSLVEHEMDRMPRHVMPQPPSRASDLPRLFRAWGVTYDPGRVVADLEASSEVQTHDGEVTESLVWLTLDETHVHGEDIVTAGIRSLMLPFAGAFEVEETPGVEAASLLRSSAQSSLMPVRMAQMGEDQVRRQFQSAGRSHDIAVRLHGRFRTAFPERGLAGGTEKEGAGHLLHRDESEKPSTVTLVANVDMLYDDFCVRRGFSGYRPINDNLALFFNAVEQLAGGPSLVDVRARAQIGRPFTRVMDMQREAAERYHEEERLLQQRLEMAQRRLQAIETQRDDEHDMILTRSQHEEIQKMRAQVRQTEQQLRQVRRKLREDIERLGAWIKGINIVLMPLAVPLVGLGFWLRRLRKQRRVRSRSARDALASPM